MQVTQISVFLQNTAGRLAGVTKTLGEAGINIRALSIADTSDFGILRLIVDKSEEALKVLKDRGYAVSKTEVIAVRVPDKPGELSTILSLLEGTGINIEYLYAFVGRSGGDAVVVFRVEEPQRARVLLSENNIEFLDEDQINKF
jgi:hypothetical protein